MPKHPLEEIYRVFTNGELHYEGTDPKEAGHQLIECLSWPDTMCGSAALYIGSVRWRVTLEAANA